MWWEVRAGRCLGKGRRRPGTEEGSEQEPRAGEKTENRARPAGVSVRLQPSPKALASYNVQSLLPADVKAEVQL